MYIKVIQLFIVLALLVALFLKIYFEYSFLVKGKKLKEDNFIFFLLNPLNLHKKIRLFLPFVTYTDANDSPYLRKATLSS
jgi:hypothetical protein